MKQLLLDCKSSLRVAIEHNTFKKYLLSLHHTILYTSSNHTILLVKLSDRKGAYYISIKKDISDIYHYVDEKEYNFSYVYTNTNNHSVIVNISMSIKYMELLKEEIVITPIPILAICWYEYLYDILEETNPNYHIVDNATAIEGISINTIPPPILYHGTSTAKLPFIEVEGIKRMQRNHVHLSSDINVATSVGKRHGTPIVLSIDTKRMYEDSYLFYLTVNNVWLTDHIPFNYINKQ